MNKKPFYEKYYLTIGHYKNNNRLYLGLENEEDCFGDITINLPEANIPEGYVAINNDIDFIFQDLLEKDLFDSDYRWLKYNYGTYRIAKVNLSTLLEYGIERR